jgi:hypothetical protein
MSGTINLASGLIFLWIEFELKFKATKLKMQDVIVFKPEKLFGLLNITRIIYHLS